MKLKIIIIIEALVIVFFIALCQIKAGEGEKATIRAEKLAQEVVELTQRAELEAERAEWAAAKYVKIESKLKDCESNQIDQIIMKLKITLIIEALVIVFFVVLSQIKAGEAMKATARAEQFAQKAVKTQAALNDCMGVK